MGRKEPDGGSSTRSGKDFVGAGASGKVLLTFPFFIHFVIERRM